ncbi:MAG: hypothetical protein DRR42_16150 [Gammaproteobacteria bacterium]|nr:MAG: hypothetical protein DRR42_16150 [Gammaproteobacteria bacterium]
MNDIADIPTSTAYLKARVETWRGSGISQRKFCNANDLSYTRFIYWHGKFERGSGSSQAKCQSSSFATVNYRPEVSGGLTLSLPNGLVLRGICADNVPVVH